MDRVNGSPIRAQQASLAKQRVADGNDGLVVAGSTGESAMLDDDERIALWRAVTGAVTVPVIPCWT